jgi:nucleoside-diphosphate-sugar epimerase
MSERLLVTGAAGFIGRNLLDLVSADDFEVHAITRSPVEVPAHAVHVCDLLDAAAVEAVLAAVEPSHLVHLAWVPAEAGDRYHSPQNRSWVDATDHLVEAFARNGGRRVVLAGSCIELDGDDTGQPASAYGASKLESGRRALDVGRRSADLVVAVARIYFVYGPYEQPNRLVPTVVRNLLAGRPAELSAGLQRRDYLHARDVASALLAILGSDLEGYVEVGSGQAPPVRRLAEVIGEALGRPELLHFGQRGGGGDTSDELRADIEALVQGTGWRPSLDLEQGLAEVVDWWRVHDGR